MKRTKKNIFLRKLAIILGTTDEMTAEEKLAQFIKDQQHVNLLERIKTIRNNSYFIPDYNKSKVYTDIQIFIEDKPISGETRLAHPRPIDFGNDIRAWKKAVRLDHKRELKAKELEAEQKESLDELIKYEFTPHIMNRMMRVD